MKYFFIIFIVLLLFTNIKSLIRYKRSKKFILENFDKKFVKKINNKIDVIIPVYNEEKNIEESVKYFKNLSNVCNAYYVTTSKEKNANTYNKLIEEITRQDTSNIFVENCPNTFGTMANQLNYIANKMPENSIIAIYNVDSRPDKKTFLYVIEHIKENEVYQQVSYFNNEIRGILQSAQNWQNRWSIIYEMGKCLKPVGKNNFIYTIGHGLFIPKSILEKYGYWSENEINEDNEFGYRLVCNNIQIKAIPYLEKADFANSLKIYIKQQSTWVNGPLYAFSYYKKLNNKNLKNLYIALLNYKAFLSWTFFPILFDIIFLMSLYYNLFYSLILMLLIVNYVTTYNYLINNLLYKLMYTPKRTIINVFKDLIFFNIHCFGSFITLYKIIKRKNNIANKYNTEK